jgi:hypothetical protein
MANFAQGIAVGFVCAFVLGLTAQAKAADGPHVLALRGNVAVVETTNQR